MLIQISQRFFLADAALLSSGNTVLSVGWWIAPERTTKEERQKHNFFFSSQTKAPTLPHDVEKINSESA